MKFLILLLGVVAITLAQTAVIEPMDENENPPEPEVDTETFPSTHVEEADEVTTHQMMTEEPTTSSPDETTMDPLDDHHDNAIDVTGQPNVIRINHALPVPRLPVYPYFYYPYYYYPPIQSHFRLAQFKPNYQQYPQPGYGSRQDMPQQFKPDYQQYPQPGYGSRQDMPQQGYGSRQDMPQQGYGYSWMEY